MILIVRLLKRLLDDPQGLYEITLLKREPRDFSLGEIKREIGRGEQIRPLYHLAKQVLPHLDISNESIKYYASLVTYYSVFRLKQLDEQVVDIYLLCFVYHRYQRLHDNLINSLIHNVRRYADEAKGAAKERVYAYQIERNQNLQKAGQVLKLFTDDSDRCRYSLPGRPGQSVCDPGAPEAGPHRRPYRHEHPLRRNCLSMGPHRHAWPISSSAICGPFCWRLILLRPGADRLPCWKPFIF